MPDTDTRTRPDPTHTGPLGPAEVRAHYVRGGGAKITEAIVHGLQVEALCGKRWIPHRDPAGLPMCERCVDAAVAHFGAV